MAEKGVLIKPQTGGVSVAARDAVQNDDLGNPRIVSLVDQAARPVLYQRATPLRTVLASDALLIDPLPVEIAGALVDTSDATSIMVYAEIGVDGSGSLNTSSVLVTPIVCDAVGVAVAALVPQMLRTITTNSTDVTGAASILLVGTYPGAVTYATDVLVFDTKGAASIGLHVTITDPDLNITSLNLYAAPSSQAKQDLDAETRASTFYVPTFTDAGIGA